MDPRDSDELLPEDVLGEDDLLDEEVVPPITDDPDTWEEDRLLNRWLGDDS